MLRNSVRWQCRQDGASSSGLSSFFDYAALCGATGRPGQLWSRRVSHSAEQRAWPSRAAMEFEARGDAGGLPAVCRPSVGLPPASLPSAGHGKCWRQIGSLADGAMRAVVRPGIRRRDPSLPRPITTGERRCEQRGGGGCGRGTERARVMRDRLCARRCSVRAAGRHHRGEGWWTVGRSRPALPPDGTVLGPEDDRHGWAQCRRSRAMVHRTTYLHLLVGTVCCGALGRRDKGGRGGGGLGHGRGRRMPTNDVGSFGEIELRRGYRTVGRRWRGAKVKREATRRGGLVARRANQEIAVEQFGRRRRCEVPEAP